jgi:hypothetical protein
MRLTNRSNLPDAIVQAVKNDSYNKGDAEFSVTGLLQPPRISALKQKHDAEIEEDVEDRLWSLLGQSIHTILERANRSAIAEKRYFGMIGGVKVSAQVDTLDLERGILSDYKVTTVWKFAEGTETPPDWIAQLNMQLELLRQNGLDATKLQIVGLLRDHQKSKARMDPGYPQSPMMGINIPIWSREKTVAFMWERIVLHQQARISLPECAPADRWERPTVYAVMKKGGKRAVKLYDNEAAARDHASLEANLFVETRVGMSARCAEYCPVSKFCTQYKQMTETKTPASAEAV